MDLRERIWSGRVSYFVCEMNHTERQLAEFRDKFSVLQRRRKRAVFASGAAWLVIVIVPFLGGADTLNIPVKALVLPSFLIFLGTVLFLQFTWKCPACQTRLAQEKVRFCHYCGVRLVE